MHEVPNRGLGISPKCKKSKVCLWGCPTNRLFAFYFRKWGTTCYACQSKSSPPLGAGQSKSSPPLGAGQKAPFYQIFRKEISSWRIKNENVQLNLN